jgi:hypothetical protein
VVDVDDVVLDAADEREGAEELDEESDDDASGTSYLRIVCNRLKETERTRGTHIVEHTANHVGIMGVTNGR